MVRTIDLRTMDSHCDNFCVFSVGSRETGRRNNVMVDSIYSLVCVRRMCGLLFGHCIHKTLSGRRQAFSGYENVMERLCGGVVANL